MIFYENLDEIVFDRHNLLPEPDEFIVISGYVGPNPVEKLESIPLKSKVIYGMYGTEGIKKKLHETLLVLQKKIENIDILYSKIPVHSKCYIWRKDKKIIHALIGSANFSISGLRTPFKEVLAETTNDTFKPLNEYLNRVIENSIACDKHVEKNYNILYSKDKKENSIYEEVGNVVEITLLDPRTGEVPNSSGLNWGQSETSHVTPNDAYIPVRADYIRKYPDLFPPKQQYPSQKVGGRANRHNDEIEIIWDDGVTMRGLLEGNLPIDGKKYPKQISTSPKKSQLGEYIRKRIGVKLGERVTVNDLLKYGRTDIKITLQGEGIYYFDFSKK